ncbi:sensor histidine kinase [Pleomorphovibrio marinus]|uniref:sensor histidine kinase n=1 Tax=Pleomorphovibrio marinus TaxID=2164132 RepID=UPI00130081CE|nr:histidine kinase [Pleomorphovibrio marinus]
MKIHPPFDRFLMMVGLSFLVSLSSDAKSPFLMVWLVSLLFTVAYWEGNYQIVGMVRQKFPRIEQTKKRIFTQVVFSLSYTVLAGIVLVGISHLISYATFEWGFLQRVVLLGLVITIIISIVYEMVFYFELWKEALLEGERLKKTEARLQFESLKNQVNPHFLFNSLNTLSSLIHSNPDKAEKFTQQFAQIYRYVLEVKDKTFVPLEKELDFVQTYIYLQKIRFGDHLIFESEIISGRENFYIPPLILQNLVENAIKHNKISEKEPLTIKMWIDGEWLKVRNNLQLRKDQVASTKTGLNNIQERFRLVSDQDTKFYKQNGYFYAEVPLIRGE